ncbi:thiol-disulfide oxidoreductase ResA [Shouchella shacheensis]|uniref:thiol-disulfide oxidoreductase ResA n=1 Tax=Shouchella shacheensis TaxID=1649580 RepID=UPI00074047BB|nr:thiol-disulfide oxidoreductase ResA [Shouchella shacheensis]
MKKRRSLIRFSILAAVALAIGYTFYANFIADHSVARAGQEAKDFVLHDREESRLQLSEMEGKGVMLNFWGTWCEPCKREMPYMEELYEDYQDQGVELVAVNVDETELTVDAFANRYDLTFPIVIDEDRKVTDAYGISPLPTTILIDETGEIIDVHTGGMTKDMVEGFFERLVPAT